MKHLTRTGKLALLIWFGCMSVILFALAEANAGEINVHIEWTYSGLVDANGFKFYQESPDGSTVMVADIQGGELRSWDGVFDAQVGRSLYYLTAYSATDESPRSAAYPFEYMEPSTPGLPAPTVIIRFN